MVATLSPDTRFTLEKELMGRKLSYYIRKSWHIIEPATPYMRNWHIDAISEHLEACAEGKIKRLLVTMPPRHMKSTAITVDFPTWVWIRYPHLRFLTASYALPLAIRDSRKSRLILESEWYRQRWPHVVLSEDQNAKSRYENTMGGYRLAISSGSGTTGEGADGIIIDDPLNARDMDAKKRETTQDWFDYALSTRLNNPKTGFIILVQQRLHEEDLAGHVLELGWEQLNLPAEYEGSKHFTSIGFKDPRTKEGELLWPSRIGPEEIAALKKVLGPVQYASQFQQRPVPKGGGQFKQRYLKYFKIETISNEEYYTLFDGSEIRRIPASVCQKIITVDLAISLKQENDYTVASVWAITPNRELLLLECVRDRIENPEQVELLELLYRRVEPHYMAVESVAYQLSIIQQLRRKGLAIKEYKPKGDKMARASTAAVQYEAGRIYHLKGASWLLDVETELLGFPKRAHDDVVDTISMAAYYLAEEPTPRLRKL